MSKQTTPPDVIKYAQRLAEKPLKSAEYQKLLLTAMQTHGKDLVFAIDAGLNEGNLAMYMCEQIQQNICNRMALESNLNVKEKQQGSTSYETYLAYDTQRAHFVDVLRAAVDHPAFKPFAADADGKHFMHYLFALRDGPLIASVVKQNTQMVEWCNDPGKMLQFAGAVLRDKQYQKNKQAALGVISEILPYIPVDYLAAHMLDDTLLLRNIMMYKPAVIQQMVQSPAFVPDAKDVRDRTFLHHCVMASPAREIDVLLKLKPALQPLINTVDFQGDTPLTLMMRKPVVRDKDRRLEWLLPYNPDLAHQNAKGGTVLIDAMLNQEVDAVRVLVEAGEADVDIGIDKQNHAGQAAIDILSYVKEDWDDLAKRLKAMSVYTTPPNIDLQVKKAEHMQNLSILQEINPDTLTLLMEIAGARNAFYVESAKELASVLPLLKQASKDHPGVTFSLDIVIQSFDGHFSTLYMDIKDGNAQSAFYEPLGLTQTSIGTMGGDAETFLDYAQAIAAEFPKDPIYINSEKIQRDSKSCTVIALDNIVHGPQYRRDGLFDRLAQAAYKGDERVTIKAQLEDAFDQPLVSMREIEVVQPYKYPAALYRNAQYLAPVVEGEIGKETTGQGQVPLREQVTSTALHSEKYNKPFNKQTKLRTAELLQECTEFLTTAHSLDDLAAKDAKHRLTSDVTLERYLSRVATVPVDLQHLVATVEQLSDTESTVSLDTDDDFQQSMDDDEWGLPPSDELPPPPPVPETSKASQMTKPLPSYAEERKAAIQKGSTTERG